ncbi:MAG: hypothetical protein ABI147_06800 [Acidobacteriaceae bacterium]
MRARAQQLEPITADEALDRVLKNNVLTYEGSPFHAIMEIRTTEGDDPAFRSRIEVFWEEPQHYRLTLESRDFGQTLVVDGAKIMETDRGDFYPGWLHAFVTALLDPIPRLKDLRGRNDMVPLEPQRLQPCIHRDDRPGGITDQMTWASACFSGSAPTLEYVLDFTYYMNFSDFHNFGRKPKQIARIYMSYALDNLKLRGKLTMIEDWAPRPDMLAVSKATPPAQRILTTFVSTATEESLLENAPKDVVWPTVREGKTDGYMIVHAMTDRTGQVRETSNHNSDNAELEGVGREVALKYKFKPLIVDGVAQQMEMPLVLHFATKPGDPIPELDDATTRKMITGCSLPHEIKDPASAGHHIVITFKVDDDGHLDTLGSSDRKILVLSLFDQFHGCHFAQYRQNGQPTPYHANLSVMAH